MKGNRNVWAYNKKDYWISTAINARVLKLNDVVLLRSHNITAPTYHSANSVTCRYKFMFQ